MMTRLSLMVLLTVCAGTPAIAGPVGFADDFEKPTIDPYWSVYNSSGSVSLTTSMAQTGLQSVQFSTVVTSGVGKNAGLYHNLDSQVYGNVSVWVYDNAAGVASSNYFSLYMSNSTTSKAAGILTYDYDLGRGTGGDYYLEIPGGIGVDTGVVRSNGWHQFSIDTTPTSQIYKIDGNQVYSLSSGFAFDGFRFGLFGPDWRPAWTTSFDNFNFSPMNTTPEPSSITLFAIASVGLFIARRRQRNENPRV